MSFSLHAEGRGSRCLSLSVRPFLHTKHYSTHRTATSSATFTGRVDSCILSLRSECEEGKLATSTTPLTFLT